MEVNQLAIDLDIDAVVVNQARIPLETLTVVITPLVIIRDIFMVCVKYDAIERDVVFADSTS